MSHELTDHPSAERMQAFLEGDVPETERTPIEEHLSACARCSAELDAWRVLFADLSSLAPPAPTSGFADRVMQRVALPAQERSWLGSLFPGWSTRRAGGHLTADLLQDVADGWVPARRVARIRAHVDSCSTCAQELQAWRGVVETLEQVDRFAPREGFAARVMAAVRGRVVAPAPAPARSGASGWAVVGARALVLARRFVPRTRRAWAALSGMAVTPAVIFGLVAYVLASHPTLTPQSLASFALWQLGDVFSAAWSSFSATGIELASLTATGSFLDLLASSPLLVAGAALAYSAFAALALRILYKNLFRNRSYARVSPR